MKRILLSYQIHIRLNLESQKRVTDRGEKSYEK